VDAFPLASALQSVQDFSLWSPAPADKKKTQAATAIAPYNQKVTECPKTLSESEMSQLPPS
jgi:hypothetical protein